MKKKPMIVMAAIMKVMAVSVIVNKIKCNVVCCKQLNHE
jgi:hypothetical protein